MTKMFTAGELAGIAEEIEKSGISFYKDLATSVDNEKIKEIFQFLAGEEVKHQKVFHDLQSNIAELPSSEENMLDTQEYQGYMKALADTAIFKKEQISPDVLKNEKGIIDYAIAREKDSVLFYTSMKDLMPENTHQDVDQIIKEEKSHILKLLKIGV